MFPGILETGFCAKELDPRDDQIEVVSLESITKLEIWDFHLLG